MKIIEETVVHQRKDEQGNAHIMYPVTQATNVIGLDEFVSNKKVLVADLRNLTNTKVERGILEIYETSEYVIAFQQ